MLIRRVLLLLTAAAVLCAGAVGLYYRGSYTDITSQDGYMDGLRVAELPESIAETVCPRMENTLEEAPVILLVTALDEEEILFKTVRAKVCVEYVLKGSGASEGDIIYLNRDGDAVHLNVEGYAYRFRDTGFVHPMRAGYTYLVFLEGMIDPVPGLESEYPVYRYLQTVIKPQFCLTDFENNVIPIDDGSSDTYADYSLLKNNEFFAASEAAMQEMLTMKAAVLDKFLP